MSSNVFTDIGRHLEAFKLGVPEYWEQLQRFNFTYTNTLFWLIIFVVMLLLARHWGIKKAFSYCIITAAFMLAMTASENYLVAWSGATAESQGLTIAIVRLVSLGLMAFISIFYLFVK